LAAVDARRALLGHLIDHAALFPPAAMSMPDALEADRRARASEDAWLLGRFVCPSSRLAELGDEQRALSLVVDDDGAGVSDPRVESLELRSVERYPGEVYVELPLDESLDERLDELVANGLRAKVRCGGASVPSVEDLARFIRGCRERELVFKATAGLHHAYPTGPGEHGFLNLLAAAAFGEEEEALSAPRGSFELDADSFRWGPRRAGASVLAQTRGTLFRSIGSCSFFEPVEELRALGAV
jgi:hypothetical protein